MRFNVTKAVIVKSYVTYLSLPARREQSAEHRKSPSYPEGPSEMGVFAALALSEQRSQLNRHGINHMRS